MKINNTELDIIRGNIVEIEADAIVCPVNNELVMYSGLASILKNKYGEGVQAEAHKKSPVDVGEAVSIKADNLKVEHIILAAVNKMDENPDENSIRSSCRDSLMLAKDLNLKSIIMPALGFIVVIGLV